MESLYDKIGGEETIKKLITPFYQKVLSDSLLGPFFAQTSLEKLTVMQEQFFSIALGGPETNSQISLAEAHQGRGIERQHLTKFTEYLLETLREVGVEESDASEVIAKIATYSGDIVGDVNVDG